MTTIKTGMPRTSVLSTIIQWGLMLLLGWGIYFLATRLNLSFTPVKHFTDVQIVLLAFCFAFTWVYILKIFPRIKPFNCITCMAGWFALIIGVWCTGWTGIIYMPVAMTLAALYSEIRMRYL